MAVDPKLYREMSVPFASDKLLSDALEAFHAEVAEARKKHKIPDVLIVTVTGYLTDGGEEGAYFCLSNCGDALKREAMAAFALGVVQSEREQVIAGFLAKGLRRKGKD